MFAPSLYGLRKHPPNVVEAIKHAALPSAFFHRLCKNEKYTVKSRLKNIYKVLFHQRRETRRHKTSIETCTAKLQFYPGVFLVDEIWIDDDVLDENLIV